jgi:alkylated DNA repair dioxygenase AlkB
MTEDVQLSLLEAEPLTLASDAEGGIVYRPGFLAADRARRAFESLRDGVAWHQDRRMMYDREVDVPRLIGHYRLDQPRALPATLKEIADAVSTSLGVPFNSVGLNYYRDQHDSVAPHHDHLYELVPGYPIALISLGGPRRMQIRRKAPPPPHRDVQVPRAQEAQERPHRAINVELAPGSLLTMSYASQLQWLHGIPKEKTPQPQRISLAFRVKPLERLDSQY